MHMVNVPCIFHSTLRHILVFIWITFLQTCVYSGTAESPWNRTLESEIGNDGNLRTKTTYQHTDTSDEVKANVLAGVMTPLILGILMTVVIILVTFVSCRSKRSGRHMTGATEVTCIDEENETESPIKPIRKSKEASSDSEMELTQL